MENNIPAMPQTVPEVILNRYARFGQTMVFICFIISAWKNNLKIEIAIGPFLTLRRLFILIFKDDAFGEIKSRAEQVPGTRLLSLESSQNEIQISMLVVHRMQEIRSFVAPNCFGCYTG